LDGIENEQTKPRDRENESETRNRLEMGWHGKFSLQSLFSDSRGLYRIENRNFDSAMRYEEIFSSSPPSLLLLLLLCVLICVDSRGDRTTAAHDRQTHRQPPTGRRHLGHLPPSAHLPEMELGRIL